MKDGLKIYACSGLNDCYGVGTAAGDFNYWRDNTYTLSNTRAVNGLLAEINLLFAQLRYKEMSESEVLYALRLIDLYVVCLVAAERYHGEDLLRAGVVIERMLESGKFDCGSMDNDERDSNLDRLVGDFESDMCGEVEIESVGSEFIHWFEGRVYSEDYCGMSTEQQVRVRKSIARYKSVSGIGSAVESDDPADWLYGAGSYYLYLYMPYKTAQKAGAKIGRRWRKQKEVLEFTHKGYDQLYPSAESVDKVIYTGVTDSLGRTPEVAVKELTGVSGKSGIGWVEILAAIIQIIGLIITLVQLIMQFVVSVTAAKYAVVSDYAGGVPSEEDDAEFAALRDKMGKGESDENKKLIKYGVIGAGIAFLLSKLKK